MDSVEFELSSRDGGVLVPYFSRISECFDVRIECENAVPRPSRDQPSPRCDELGPVQVGVEGGRTRLKLSLSANSEHSLQQAKAFIEGVTQQPQTEPYERHLTLSPDQFEALVGIHHGVQQETQTIFLFKHETYTVSILGQPLAVKMAQSLATQRILGCDTAELPSQALPRVVTPSHWAQTHQKLSPTQPRKSRLQRRPGPGLKVNMGCWVTGGGHGRNAEGEEIGGEEEDAGRMHVLSLSPGAESAPDSCYDSDGSRSGSRRSSCTRSDSDLHTDVSRTVSDTLAAELLADADPITTKDTTTSENQLLPPALPASKSATRVLSVDNGSSHDTLVKQETQEFSISGAEAEGLLGTDTAAQVTAGLLAMSLDAAIDSNTNGAPEETRVAEYEEQEEDEQKVLYGIRLGYSQELTQRVLDKLGPEAGKDDLLQELIRHTEVEKDEEEDEEEEDKPVVCAWVRSSPAISSAVGDDEDVVDGRTHQQQPSRVSGDLQAAGGKDLTNLRCIIIDGSNIAMSHGNKQVFSCRGIRLAVDYFRERGHAKVTVFVPSWRKEASRQDTQIVDQDILYELEKEGTLVFTPSRWVQGKRIVCYDDLYIIKLAAEDDGVVVSNDNYRDLINKSPEYKKVIEERLLMYSFVNDRFMPPDDPLGRHGPSLDNFLSKQPVVAEPLPPACPYGKKCTYGNKCKYYHPERGTTPRKSVVEVLQEKERVERAKVRSITQSRETSPGDIGSRGKSPTPSGPVKKALIRTQSLVPGPKPGPAKKALIRTRSLVPGAMGGASIQSGAAAPPDFLQLKVKTDDVATGCRVTVTTATPTETTATTAASELSRKEYDARLSKYRREVEVAESEQQAKHELLGRKSSATNSGQSLESLQLPGSWSSGGASRVPDPLNQLRPRQAAHSDPQGGCGHLALAKKLSDEGKAEEKRRNVQPVTTSAVDMGAHSSPPRQHQEEKTKKNGHRQLQRQLSLQGSDDPRLLPKGSSRGGSNSAQGGQKPKKDKGPDVIFHGGSGPVHKAPYPHREQETMVHFGQPGSGVTCTFIGDRSEQQHQQHHPHLQHHQHQHQHRPLGAMGRRHEIAGHSQLQRHSSDGENLRSDRRYMVQQQQQGMRAPPERKQACRMASAPGTYPYLVAGSNGQGPQRRSSNVMPTIHRQNSTSDPQLHILQDNNSSHGNVLDTIMLGMYNPPSAHPGFGGYSGAPESVNNNMMWAQSHSFDVPAGGGIKNTALFDGHLNLPGPTMDERMPRGGSFDGSLPGHLSTSTSFDNTIHPSGSYEDITANRKYAALDGNMSSMHPFYQQHQQQHEHPNKHSPEHKAYGSDQSLYMAGRMHMPGPGDNFGLPPHMMAPRKSSPDIYNFLSQPSPPQQSPSAPQQQQGPLQSTQQDVYVGQQMGHRLVNSISPVMMVGGDGRLASAPSPPHPDDQTPGNMPDLQTNRQKLFYHLTALFPEVEVREAMQRLPMETQPDKLVACIMTIRSLHSTA